MCDCKLCSESEDENSFWADVCSYMEEFHVAQEEAAKEVRKMYADACL